ncbi:MAG: preprotein translocase subunit SecA [Bacteroidetes bacterium]|nr:preprotein translocase subunit SecA [Bacteroidota bacterium]NOG56835.1 preprotein translocase subunit SecA [Bacteroidota bacterium]
MFGALSSTIKKILGSKTDRDLKEVTPIVEQIKAIFPSLASLSNDELRNKTTTFKQRINDYLQSELEEISKLKSQIEVESNLDQKEILYKKVDEIEDSLNGKIEEVLKEILPEAFAVVKETARRFTENTQLEVTANQMDRDIAAERDSVIIEGDKAIWKNSWHAAGAEITWDMIHYDVQLIGGYVLHSGKIAEMATGEGKTLVATLPVYLNALAGRGVHLVTVNNYLAKRDSEWMGPLFEFHGLTVDCIDNHQPNSNERRKAYQADITYGTNNEFGFDYLRDNMSRTPEELVQRKHHYAIIDEVDSVLIDDARTPLIISGPTPKGDKHEFHELKPMVDKLVSEQRKLITTLLVDAKKKLHAESSDSKEQKKLHEEGGMALLRAFRGLPRNKALIKFLSESGIKAQLQKTENFYMQDQSKEMHLVDAELYFVIDEKNNSIELTEKGIELISGSEDKEFFILPDINMELSKIDSSNKVDEEKIAEKDKIIQEYSIKAERIHTVNQLLKAYTLFEKDTEYVIMDNKVKIVDEQTGRIMEGRRYSDGLHQAIEAKENVKVEAATQTYATVTLQNYFRMYHKLSGMTGTAETEAGELWDIYKLDVVTIPTNKPIARDDREDMVFKTTREKYNAVSEEIVELVSKGRPVLVGTTSVEISELLSRMLKMKNIKHNVLNAKMHQKEADIVTEAGKSGTVTIATNMAGRGTDIKLSKEVKEAGGLAIIGTERHESRRVDRQLRGRAGRQGDPGSSQFYVSLEDNLMRLFGSDRIASLMDRMGLEEGEVIQHSMITKSIERAQKKVEENNFGVRKRLLEYDDVMNSQREVIYRRRRNALYGERISVDIANMMYDSIASITDESLEGRDYENFKFDLIRNLSIDSPVNEEEFLNSNADELTNKIYQTAINSYQKKTELVAKVAFPVISNVYHEEGTSYENIVVPFTDGKRTIQVVTPLKKAFETEGKELIKSFEKNIILAMIDNAWKEHLREMDDLKQSVQGAVYEQKDPLLIYKFEAFELFKQMIDRTNKEIITFLVKGNLPQQAAAPTVQQAPQRVQETPKLQTSRTEVPSFSRGDAGQGGGTQTQEKPKAQPVRVEKKVGRNEPCPCGSGKKFKQCHGK